MQVEAFAAQALDGLLVRAVAARPAHTALVCGPARMTYAMLGDAVASAAATLRSAGVESDDHVIVFLENGIDMVVALLATWHVGAVCVTVNAQTKSAKLDAIAASIRPRLVMTQQSLEPSWFALAGRTNICLAGEHSFATAGHLAVADLLSARCDPTGDVGDRIALISHTSGTTGSPKGVMLSHRNLFSALASIQAYLGIRVDDILLSALPLSFNYGLTQLLLSIEARATLVLERSFAFPAPVLDRVVSEKATVFAGVPMMYAAMLGMASLDRWDLSRLRILTNASAALPVERVRALRQRFPDARLFLMYGQTECTRISYLPPEEVDRRPDSVGRGIAGQRHWLVDEQGQRVAPGASGELIVCGPHVMHGYWNARQGIHDPASIAASPMHSTSDRVLATGDVFRTDQDGWLYFVARKDDIIKTRGEKVSPAEVETVIRGIDGVADVFVGGVPDTLLGEAVCAWVVLRGDVVHTERDIIRVCLNRLESFMAPRHVVFVDAFPRTPTGKVSRSELPSVHPTDPRQV